MPLRLLVSVRNGNEAAAAIEGGCDIVDVKEPQRGALGMADVSKMADVVAAVRRKRPYAIVSVALGEIADWRESAPPALPAGITFAKLGAAGLLHDPAWSRTWSEVRRRCEAASGRSIAWIAVAYADWQRAQSPPPLEMAAAAAEAGCHGVLFDTFTKTGRGLLEWLPASELCELARQIHSSGQFVALAGQVSADDLPELSVVDADIVAIRSAACAQGQRTNEIAAEAVRRFKSAMSGVPVPCLAQPAQKAGLQIGRARLPPSRNEP